MIIVRGHRQALVSAALVLAVATSTACGDEPAAGGRQAADATSPGQADLDAAVDAKLSAQSIDDFANVLDLCRRAIK
ncbi:MAG: hypothetical protein ACKOTB_15215, partial [Planctomycetia bacterium]